MEIQGYKIHRKIGEGAMAGVYLADQESLGRRVALKLLSPALAGQPGFTERFLKEGRIIAYLKHPQIVDIYDLGSHRQHYYLSMEYLSGGTLEQKIKGGLSTSQSIQMIKQISHALGFAHMNGVIHRDIKPQNIMFGEDHIPVLTDFGIARLMDSDPQLTIPGRTVGSPLYMSPEQISGRKIDARADLYSIGVLFYKMLTQKLPYQSEQFVTIALMHQTAPIPVLPQNQALLQPVLEKLLAKDPDQRYSSAQELISALLGIQSNTPFIIDDPEGELADAYVRTRAKKKADHNINMSDIRVDPMTAEHTRPTAQLSSSDAGDTQHTILDKNDAGSGAKLHMQPGARKPTKGLTDATAQRLGLVLAAVILVVAGGIYALDGFHKDRTAEPPLSSSAQMIQAEPLEASFPADNIGSESKSRQSRADSTLDEDTQAETQDGLVISSLGVTQRIESLVTQARGQLAKHHLTSPKGDNSYETYQQILAIDPSGQSAQAILMEIGGAYYQLALNAKEKGSLNQALRYVVKGIELLPENTPMLNLQNDLRVAVAAHARIARKQAEETEQARKLELQTEKEKQLNDQQAMVEKMRKIEQELSDRRIRQAELERLQRLAEREKLERKKEKLEMDRPVSTEREADNRKRLFGTF